MSGINPKQLINHVIRPTLAHLGLGSVSAELLIAGTIAQESGGKYLKQLGNGPALGIVQMEPATYKDIWMNYLKYRSSLSLKVSVLASKKDTKPHFPNESELISNLSFAVAMCRVHYRRVTEPLPVIDDFASFAGFVEALGKYWKQYYNTHQGAGTVQEFIDNFPMELMKE